MSRHRNVRALDVDEEYDGYYSCYGHSVEEDFCISPRTEEQFLYNRSQKQSVAAFVNLSESVPEESNEQFSSDLDSTVDSQNLNPLDKAKLLSCIEAMQDVVGDTVPEDILHKIALQHDFNLEQSLNAVLQGSEKDKRIEIPVPNEKNQGSKTEDKKSEKISSSNGISSDETADCVKISNARISSSNEISSDETTDCVKIRNASGKENSVNQKDETSVITTITNEKLESEGSIKGTPKSGRPIEDPLQLYIKEKGDQKPLINLVVIGHVDAGKSTLMGHLLYRLGRVTQRTMHKFEQESKKVGKSSFAFAWVLDETPEERNRGITMGVAESSFETKERSVLLLDTPGHKYYIPNMITGAAQADAALLVIDSTRGEFETGFEAGGQTREHTILIRSLGVSQMAVVVNKMDNINWSEERFNEVKAKISSFFKSIGFKENDVTFIPCSGLSGENLASPPETDEFKKWYSGPTLVDVINKFQPPERPVSKPLRICIDDVFKGVTGGFCISGKIEGGYVRIGDKVVVLPSGEVGVVKGMTIDDNSVLTAFAGDKVIMQLTGVDSNNILSGSIVCDIEKPIKMSSLFQARIVIFSTPIPITKGFPVILHYKCMAEEAVIKKLLSQLHKSTGEIIKKKPRCLSAGMSAVVEIEVSRQICLELFQDFKDLGRFMLRYCDTTIAAGVVTRLM